MLLMHVFHVHLLLCASIFLSFVHMLLVHMLHGYLLILVQVFIVVRTCASNAYASWTLAYFSYKYLLSFVHVLLMHMFLMHMLHGHLLIFIQVFIVVRTCASNAYASWTLAYFCTSIYCRAYMYF
jgi:energy-converting hydrogenase Eha subunit B